MTIHKPAPRRLQQQPARFSDPQQQRSGSADFQPAMVGWMADAGRIEAHDLERTGREARARFAVGPQLPAFRAASALLG